MYGTYKGVTRNFKQPEKQLNETTDDVYVQMTDWWDGDITEFMNEEDEENKYEDNKQYTVFGFGVNENGESVSIKFVGYRPYFYIKVPDEWLTNDIKFKVDRLIDDIKQKVYYCYRKDGLMKYAYVKAKSLYYFTGNDKNVFVKLICKNQGAMRSFVRTIEYNKFHITSLEERKLELFESNIPPLLRFFHVVNIQPAHWIKIPKTKYKIVHKNDRLTRCQIELKTLYNSVIKVTDRPPTAKMNQAGFDIESTSSHGDFPLGKKDYSKLANDMMDSYIYFKKINYVTDEFKWINDILKYAFDDYNVSTTMKYIALKYVQFGDDQFNIMVNNITNELCQCVSTCNETDTEQVMNILLYNLPEIDYVNKYTSNLLHTTKRICEEFARLRRFKIQEFCDSDMRYETIKLMIENIFNPSFNNITINRIYTKSNEKPNMVVLELLATDILLICRECYTEIQNKKSFDVFKEQTKSTRRLKVGDFEFKKRDHFVLKMTNKMDNKLPNVKGDETIQIGTTFQHYGDKQCFLKHIVVLGSCDKITLRDTIDDENKDIDVKDSLLYEEMKNCEQFESTIRDMTETEKQQTFDQLTTVQKDMLKTLIVTRERDKQIGEDYSEVIVESYDTEKEVLLTWARLIRQTDPDIILGYNIFGFDYEFLVQRAEELNCLESFRDISRFEYKLAEYNILQLKSGGMGDNELKHILMHGRISIDLLKRVQGEFKLESYKLDKVCYQFLNKKKNDLPPQQIFIKQRGTSSDRCTIARYCLVDCLLCNRLTDELQIIGKNISMANVCSVPLSYLFFRGQGIKLFSLVSKECRLLGYIVPTIYNDEEDEEKYEGAVVLNANNGIHIEPTSVADYNSLYPSCMIASNISHDTFVVIGGKYDNIDGYDYLDIQYTNYIYVNDYTKNNKLKQQKKKVVNADKPVITCRYVQYRDEEKGVMPKILQKLLQSRKDTRKIQAQFKKKSIDWLIKEGEQLAFKVTANSLYGQCGSKDSKFRFKEIAASVTASGRKNLEFARDEIESNYDGSSVIYGDSVTGETPITVKIGINGFVEYVCIKDLQNEVIKRKKYINELNILRRSECNHIIYNYETFKPHNTKLTSKYYIDLSDCDIYVWTANEWKKLLKYIFHDTYKRIFRCSTINGFVDVTEDHSLINNGFKYIKPHECEVMKTRLLCKKLHKSIIHDKIKNIQKCDDVSHNSYVVLHFGNKREKFTPSWECKIMDSVITNVKHVMKSHTHIHLKFENDRFNELKFYCVYLNYVINECLIECKDNASYYITTDVGHVMLHIVYLQFTPNSITELMGTNSDILVNVLELKRDMNLNKYITVYDIETEDGTFQAGVGDIIVKNTDSIFIKFKNTDMCGREISGQASIDRSIQLCIEGSQRISKQLVKPHNLEFEKCIYPFILFTKKRYHGHYYTVGCKDSYYQNSMGIELKRRDNAHIVKKVFGGAINIIMKELDMEKALEFVRQSIQDIYLGKYSMDDFIITKTLQSTYKNPDTISHKVLADRIKLRDPGNAPRSNDRVPYVFIKVKRVGKEKILQGNMIETPEYVIENKLELDYNAYLTRQIYKPIARLFGLHNNTHVKKIEQWITQYNSFNCGKTDMIESSGLFDTYTIEYSHS